MNSSRNGRSTLLSQYFSEIRAYPLLTKDEEHLLASLTDKVIEPAEKKRQEQTKAQRAVGEEVRYE